MNHQATLNKIEDSLQNVKTTLAETYKKVKNCKDESDHNLLCDKL